MLDRGICTLFFVGERRAWVELRVRGVDGAKYDTSGWSRLRTILELCRVFRSTGFCHNGGRYGTEFYFMRDSMLGNVGMIGRDGRLILEMIL